jgi:hypothetical protein
LFFREANFVHDLFHCVTVWVLLPENGTTQGKPEFRQFDGATEILGNSCSGDLLPL